MLEVLRPAPQDAVMPFDLEKVLGKTLTRALDPGAHLTWTMLTDSEVR